MWINVPAEFYKTPRTLSCADSNTTICVLWKRTYLNVKHKNDRASSPQSVTLSNTYWLYYKSHTNMYPCTSKSWPNSSPSINSIDFLNWKYIPPATWFWETYIFSGGVWCFALSNWGSFVSLLEHTQTFADGL